MGVVYTTYMATKKAYTGEEAQEHFRLLPALLRGYLYSHDMMLAIEKVGEKNHLHLDQLSALESEINSVILGFTEPQDFPGMVAEALDLPEEQAQAVAGDVDVMLFQHVRELVRESMPAAVPTGVVGGRMGAASGAAGAVGVSPLAPQGETLPPLLPEERAGVRWERVRGGDAAVAFPGQSPAQPLATPLASAGSDKVSFADRALSGPTESMIRTVDVTPIAPLKHAVDPYREPIE